MRGGLCSVPLTTFASFMRPLLTGPVTRAEALPLVATVVVAPVGWFMFVDLLREFFVHVVYSSELGLVFERGRARADREVRAQAVEPPARFGVAWPALREFGFADQARVLPRVELRITFFLVEAHDHAPHIVVIGVLRDRVTHPLRVCVGGLVFGALLRVQLTLARSLLLVFGCRLQRALTWLAEHVVNHT